MTKRELLERYFLARILWWREAIMDMEEEAVLELETAISDLKREIAKAVNSTSWQRERLAGLATYLDELILAASDQTAETILEATIGAGQASLENWNMMLSVGKTAVGVSYVAMSREQIKSWFQDTPLGGHSLNEWVKKAFDEGIRKELAASLRKSALQGLGYGPMVKKLMQTALETGAKITQREAITLARTYTQTANVEAQKAVYEQNSDIVYGRKWTSVLDNRVCPRCAALDGVIYKNGEKMPPIPLHPRCRCLLLPCVRVGKMGVGNEDLERVARPWVVRQPGNIDMGGRRKILSHGHTTEDFGGWYRTLSEAEQKRIVGPVRQRLLAEGKISFGELVDKGTGKLRRLQELGFDAGGKLLYSKDYKDAVAGGKNSGLYKQILSYSDKELLKSQRSFLKQVNQHQGYIDNPRSHVSNWDDQTELYRRNTLKMWERHKAKNQAQYNIVSDFLRNKLHDGSK